MMRVIEKTCSGCVMSSPNKMYQLIKHSLGYVDDKRQYSNDWNDKKIETIIKKLTQVAQSWKQWLYTTNRKLEISKCGIYIIEWIFDDDGRVTLVPMHYIELFTLTSSFADSKYIIKILSNDDCMKYLGIQSDPWRNQDAQYKSSIDIAKISTRTLDINLFGRYHAELYINAHLHPKNILFFNCSSLSNEQYIYINK